MRKASINYKGSKICYQVCGKGKPVMLIHGFGEAGALWANIVKNLSEYCFIIPDIPGSGDSELLNFKKAISIEDYGDAMHAILHNEQISKCTIIGHSMGGYIALSFAEKWPEFITGLGLFHSSAFRDDEKKIEVRRKAIEFIKDNGGYSFLKTSIPNLFTEHYLGNNPHMTNQLIEQFAGALMPGQSGDKVASKRRQTIENKELYWDESKDNALIQYYEAMIARPDKTDILKIAPYAILYIIGEFDTAIQLESSLKQSHLSSISDVHILPVGHMGMLQEPEKCCEYIRSYLQLVNNQAT